MKCEIAGLDIADLSKADPNPLLVIIKVYASKFQISNPNVCTFSAYFLYSKYGYDVDHRIHIQNKAGYVSEMKEGRTVRGFTSLSTATR